MTQLRYLKTLVPCRDFFGVKTGKYKMEGKGVVLQHRDLDGEWKDINVEIEVDD